MPFFGDISAAKLSRHECINAVELHLIGRLNDLVSLEFCLSIALSMGDLIGYVGDAQRQRPGEKNGKDVIHLLSTQRHGNRL
jgi:hypothetical protein